MIILRHSRIFIAAAAVVLSVLTLSGCMPDYNWRDVRSTEQHYLVTLPGKPASMVRNIDLDGLKVAMTMQGVKINEVSFTVAAVTLPDQSDATRAKAVQAMKTGMLRNVNGKVITEQPHTVLLLDASDKKQATLQANRLVASGSISPPGQQPKPVELHAIFIAKDQQAWQVVVMGPASALAAGQGLDAAKQMLDSFRLVP